ncbi:hypothetical protein [Aeromonas piscicola]|uniref:hypothetical protein n=1 Tax=Aeromonas piscicola TaxID=600645 RepID=UPI0021F8CD15|nr:hypothetical protein [Aeromonas piscicola]MCW0506902.1 hypothetical protein [Aeromonas piscicola]
MSLLEAIQSKQVDIYISLFFTLLGLVLGVIVDSIRNSSPSPANQQGNFFNLTVNNVVNPPSSASNRAQDDQGLLVLIVALTTIFGITYLFFRSEILNILSFITIFSISLWAGGTLHSLYKGYFSGGAWLVSLVFSSAFCVAALFVVSKAFSPNHAPKYFQYSQEIINKYGIAGLPTYFNEQDLRWFMFHLIGVFLLFQAKIRMTLSSTYFLAAGRLSLAENIREPWIVRRTRKYANLNTNILYVSILSISAYYFISGDFFMWFEYKLPIQFKSLINIVLHGRG